MPRRAVRRHRRRGDPSRRGERPFCAPAGGPTGLRIAAERRRTGLSERVRLSPATVTARIVAVAVDGIIGTCAIFITLMVTTQKGLAQIGSMAPDPASVEELAPGIAAAKLVALALPFLFALQIS